MANRILTYVGTPYSHEDPAVVQERFEVARDVTETIIGGQDIIIPFTPIVYTHQFSHIGINWVKWDIEGFLKLCKAMMFVQMSGWSDSEGLQHEKYYCQRNGIPIYYTSVESVLKTCQDIVENFESGIHDFFG